MLDVTISLNEYIFLTTVRIILFGAGYSFTFDEVGQNMAQHKLHSILDNLSRLAAV